MVQSFSTSVWVIVGAVRLLSFFVLLPDCEPPTWAELDVGAVASLIATVEHSDKNVATGVNLQASAVELVFIVQFTDALAAIIVFSVLDDGEDVGYISKAEVVVNIDVGPFVNGISRVDDHLLKR